MRQRKLIVDAKKIINEVNSEIQNNSSMLEIQKEQAANAVKLIEEVFPEGKAFVFEKNIDTVELLVSGIDAGRVIEDTPENRDKVVRGIELLIKSFRPPQKHTGTMHKELRPGGN